MKRFVIAGMALVAIGAAAGCLQAQKGNRSSETGLLYRHHFVGTDQIAKGTNATKLKEVLALDTSKALREQVLTKLAKAPRQLWPKQVSQDGADLLRPLLEDLCANESHVEVRGSLEQPEWVFAVALSEERDKLWNKNLKALAGTWKLGNPAAKSWEKFQGWEIKRGERPKIIQVARAGKWTLVGIGPQETGLLTSLLQKAAQANRPVPELKGEAILELETDTPRLATVLPVLAPFHFPPAQFTVFGRGENLRTEGKIRPAERFLWKWEPWKIPTNRIPASIISFTVAQGIAPMLKDLKPMAELGLKSYPNQFCAWGPDAYQVQTYWTVPADDVTNLIQKASGNIPKVAMKYLKPQLGQFGWVSNRAEVVWFGVPFIVPMISPLREPGQDYVLFSMFPLGTATSSPPAQLLAQLGNRKDLAYYDWEMTGYRLVHTRQYFQLYNIFAGRRVPSEKAPAQKWLAELPERLGNTITEITVASNQELNFVRKSHIGLSSLELAILGLWLESPSFPLRIDPEPKPEGPGTNAPPASFTNRPPVNSK
jgi:hypothetical protein